MQGKLIILSAPSGSGKTTIAKYLLDKNLGLEFSVSATSRLPREDEQHGIDYYFMPPEVFRQKIENEEFLEWEEVYDKQYYGTLRSEVTRIWNNGHHAIFDIDVKGGLNLKKEFGDIALAIFISPPSLEILEDRLRTRKTEDESSLRKRLDKAAYEFSFRDRFDRVIVNNHLEDALIETEKIVLDFINEKPAEG
jgi:guanylate kinase